MNRVYSPFRCKLLAAAVLAVREVLSPRQTNTAASSLTLRKTKPLPMGEVAQRSCDGEGNLALGWAWFPRYNWVGTKAAIVAAYRRAVASSACGFLRRKNSQRYGTAGSAETKKDGKNRPFDFYHSSILSCRPPEQ